MICYRCPLCGSLMPLPMRECRCCGCVDAAEAWEEVEQRVAPPDSPSLLLLSGDLPQQVRVRRGMTVLRVGRPVLMKVSSEGRYADYVQFEFEWRGNACFVVGSREAPNETLLNGSLLSGEAELHHGDRLCLRGRASGRLAMVLVVEYVS